VHFHVAASRFGPRALRRGYGIGFSAASEIENETAIQVPGSDPPLLLVEVRGLQVKKYAGAVLKRRATGAILYPTMYESVRIMTADKRQRGIKWVTDEAGGMKQIPNYRIYWKNPDEQQRHHERAGAAGDLEAQARHLVGLIRQGKVRADHVQSLAALGDPVATLAVGKPKSTEGSTRLIFTDVDLVREWGPVWAVIAATSFMEVLSPEFRATPPILHQHAPLRDLIWHGQAWVNCYGLRNPCVRNCNLREHSSAPVNTCFYDYAHEEVADAIERAWGVEGWTLHAQSAALHYMILVDSADSAVRGEPPRLYRAEGRAESLPDSFGYDLWPVWSNVANALSLKASSTTHGHNYDQPLRQRAIDNLKPWILAGSPDAWNMDNSPRN
jgi:hypothetical protein